jgi:hypothetical protein
VLVLVHGDWIRLASEPYGDPTDRQLAALLCAGLGITLLGSGLLVRRRAAALRRAPVPVLRVLTRRSHGRTEIFAADDTGALHPALTYRPHDGNWTSLRQGLLYGAPCEGAELVLASATEAGQWLVEVNVSAIQPGAAVAPAPRSAEREAAHSIIAEAQVQEALASMAPADGPLRWRADPVTRSAAMVALLLWVAVAGIVAESKWWLLIIWAPGMVSWVISYSQMVSWRITADAAGLSVRSLRSVRRERRVAWADVAAVVITRSGELTVSCRNGTDDFRVGSTGSPGLERLLRRPAVGERAAVEISAMVLEPGLRPTGPTQFTRLDWGPAD